MKHRIVRLVLLSVALITPSLAHAQLGGVSRYCTPGAAGARISVSGSASFTAGGGSGDLVLHAAPVPSGAPGLFLFGSAGQQPIPFGNGFRCVTGTVHRLPIVTPGVGNESTFPLDFATSPGSAITPGSFWYFQFWFRAAGGTFDLSDALQIEFGPPVSIDDGVTISQGYYSGHPLGWQAGGGVLLVQDQAEWDALWAQHETTIPPTSPPFVDFTQHAVVCAFGGWFSTSGYTYSVRHLDLSVATLNVTTLVRAPGMNCFVLFVITQPFHFVRVPRVDHMTLGAVTVGFDAVDCP